MSVNEFMQIFEKITGVTVKEAVDAQLDGKEDELMLKISANAKSSSRNPLEDAVNEMNKESK